MVKTSKHLLPFILVLLFSGRSISQVGSYCSPDNGTTLHLATGPTIDYVSIVGTSLSNASPGAPTSGYTLFPDSANTTANLQQANVYSLQTTFSANVIASVWFDWNQDGMYDATEWTQITTNDSGTITTPISIPANALLGMTGMRIRSRLPGNANGATDACTTFGSGETEEYIVNITKGTFCSGKPSGGFAFAPPFVCPNSTFVLTDTGFTTGAIGISYQWQTSIDSGASWTSVIGDTMTVEFASIGQKSWFRLKSTCVTTNDSSFSNIVTVDILPALACGYCSPSNGTTLHVGTGPSIDSVSITGTTLNNVSPGEPASGYTLFIGSPNMTATLQTGSQYLLQTSYPAPVIASVWFDWNQDGVYDSTEWTQITTNGSGLISTAITVPANALLGQTGMRIRSRNPGNPNSGVDACTTFGSGETQEYFLSVVQGSFCKGKPNAGVVVTPASICPSATLSLTDTGATTSLGISYQWQTSLDNGASWNAIIGDTTPVSSTSITQQSWFRFSAVCTTTKDTTYSNVTVIGLLPQFACQYCSPNNGVTLHLATGPFINAVSITGSTLNDSTSSTPASGYTLFPDTLNTTCVLQRGAIYTLNTTFTGGLAISSVWFDWNQDGVFDSTEWVQISPSDSGLISTDITVPTSALVGKLGMRIRARAENNNNGPTDACTTFGSGETQDYIVSISPVVPCTSKPVAGVITGSPIVCPNAPFTLVDTGFTSGLYGIYYQWQVSLDSGATWNYITTDTVTTLTDSLNQNGWFLFTVGCNVTGDTTNANVFSVNTKCVTPVTLLPLQAIRKNNANVLQWATAQESNNNGFEVYRSINGKDYIKIGWIGSLGKLGNSTKRLDYQFVDATEEPKAFYKIRQIDLNGIASFSNVVVLNASTASELQLTGLYPNPVSNSFNVDLSAPNDMTAKVIIFDIVGKVVLQNNFSVGSGYNQIHVSTNGLASGSYLLKCVGENGKQTSLYKFYKK